MKTDKQIALDCHEYFILGRTDRYSPLGALFNETYKRTDNDYYPEISKLCLYKEMWLAAPEEWTNDELGEFAADFRKIVPWDDPNY